MNKFKLHNTLITLGSNAFVSLRDFIEKNKPTKIFVLVDKNTKKYCLPIFLQKNDLSKRCIIIELDSFSLFNNSESLKSMHVVTEVCKYLLIQNIDRNSLIINLGGGVICDLGGFIASVIKRGVPFINVPTTFMSQIDASIGGKVAVNCNNYKNQIGLFNDPELVIIYPPYNLYLRDLDFDAAVSEVLKYGLIIDRLFWKNLTIDQNTNICFKGKVVKKDSNLEELISECVKIKIGLVKSDYYDLSSRRKLNFGHSISHALESCSLEKSNRAKSSDTIHHGSALALGMICETYLSYKKFNFAKSILNEVVAKISKLFPYIDYNEFGFRNFFREHLQLDKKNIDGIYQFTLIQTIGDSVINIAISDAEVLESLDYYDQIYMNEFS